MSYLPFDDQTLCDLEDRFDRVHVYTPEPRARSSFRPAGGSPPEPPFSVVFRPADTNEWRNIMGQANTEKQKPSAPRNLALATVIAVSVNGEHTILDVNSEDAREARIPVRRAFEALISKWPGLPEAVTEDLSALAGVVAGASEKG